MSQSGHSLHFNRVSLLERFIQNSWGVDHLPAEISVVHVSNIERLSREGVRLNFYVGPSDLKKYIFRYRYHNRWIYYYFVDEAGFANVGEAAEDDGTSVRVNGR